MPIKVIHDGDHGSDDFITTAILASSEQFELLGVTTCLGNISARTAAKNATRALSAVNRQDIPVFIGCNKPLNGEATSGDEAFGDSHGLGSEDHLSTQDLDSAFPSEFDAQEGALEWLETTLEGSKDPITVVVTGPCTNIATLIQNKPALKNKIERLIIMGGCANDIDVTNAEWQPENDQKTRRGNITEWAEFNFERDPEAAEIVLNSGIPVVLLPMDATHQLVYNPNQPGSISERFNNKSRAAVLDKIMTAAGWLDGPKFGVDGTVQHDAHTALWLLQPALYETTKGCEAHVDTGDHRGALGIFPHDKGTVTLVNNIVDPEQAYDTLATNIQQALDHS